MQSTFELIHSLQSKGISLSLVNDLLKVEPKELITAEIRMQIKTNREELIQALQISMGDSKRNSAAPTVSCWQCRFFDGVGSSFPGMCQLLPEVKEIDPKVVNPDDGCRSFVKATKNVKKAPSLNKQTSPIRTPRQEDSERRSRVKLPLPVALTWLGENRQALDKAGWTRAEFYRRNKSKRGIAWLPIWQRSDLDVSIQSTGVIRFYFKDRGISQSATPRKLFINGAQ